MVFPGLEVDDSRPALFSRCLACSSSTTAVACAVLGLLVVMHRALCSDGCPGAVPQNGEVCTVVAFVFPVVVRMEIWTLLLRASHQAVLFLKIFFLKKK